ncbi:gliding motility-associated C-terminal domain-containing protein [Pontibacter actiniarum]|uniref:Cadherin domain-containing protein n=1 Tax=Pontibacter actiniarum TaxID=323450 RepID=A0A1X9YMP9_9BACT|nr:gliding motility-associated C-terminal domain-containing protein [Pontibacter actiniarum]ARS34163.1 hypothetical protein CA264_01175 [Pontibacter actiniarum]
MKTRLLLLALLLLFYFNASATHIVGGEFELQHLSEYNYRLFFNLYFDQLNGSPGAKDGTVRVTIFEKGTNQSVTTVILPLRSEKPMSYTNVGCTTSNLKTTKMVYSEDIYLDPAIYNSPAGYYVAWERCCRNNTINNIAAPESAGTTFYMEFPAVVKEGAPFVNSSPRLSPPPNDYACVGELFYYNFSSTDADGDELVYDLVTPLNGYSSPNNVSPPASSAPYSEIRWLPGYSNASQIQGAPALSIDSETGRLTVTPLNVGLFVFGVRCQEFRNGVKIGEVRRDFQLLVKACHRNETPEVTAVTHGSSTPYQEGQVLRIGPTDSRCIKVYFTDPDKDEPLTLAAKPVNFNNHYFRFEGDTTGIVNTANGQRVLEASLCLDRCFTTNGETYLLDLITSDDGDNGCGLPRQDTLRISMIVEPMSDTPPTLSFSTNKRVIEVAAGETVSFDVTGSDPDEEEVIVSAVGKNFNLNSANITFSPAAGVGTVSAPFSWQIDCEAVKQPSYEIAFTVTTPTCGQNVTRTETIEIRTKQFTIEDNVASGEQTICSGQVPDGLTGSTPTGGPAAYTYSWEVSTTSASSGFTEAPGSSNAQDYSPEALTSTTWFRRRVTSGLCTESISAPVKVTVNKPIRNNAVSGNQTICKNTAPALLKGTAPQGGNGSYTYRWEYSTVSGNSGFRPAEGNNTAQNYQPAALSQTTWFKRIVQSQPCEAVPSQVIQVTVVPTITRNTVSGNQLVCYAQAPAQLTGTTPAGGSGGYTYRWEYSTVSATAGFAPAPGTHTNAAYTAGPLTQNTWFRRVAASGPCEDVSNTVLVTVDPLPAPPTAEGAIICPAETATLQASSPAAGYVLEWYDQPAGGRLLHTGSTYTTPALHTTTSYYVQTVNSNGCATAERIPVSATVMPPTADAGPDQTIIQGKYAELRAKGGTTYTWSPATSLSDPTLPNPVAKPQETITYTVTTTSEYGCVYTDEVTVTVLPRVEPTNAITMNGDQVNDTWHIRNIEHYPDCRVKIFTRWGALIYESQGYKEPWNGTHHGKSLPMAAYYYVIELGVGKEQVAGSITLIK